MEIHQRLRNIREDSDKTQEEIAKILNTDRSYYGKYERGVHPMTAEQIAILSRYYNLSADYLLCLVDEPKKLDL